MLCHLPIKSNYSDDSDYPNYFYDFSGFTCFYKTCEFCGPIVVLRFKKPSNVENNSESTNKINKKEKVQEVTLNNYTLHNHLKPEHKHTEC